MTMPNNLVLVRHGQSEANVLQSASKAGDESLFTDEMMNYPDRSWRLTAKGVEQAQASGEWIVKNISEYFDRYIVSPFIRTRETAAHLSLPDASWEENRVVRERSWGEIDSMSRQAFERSYPVNARYKSKDPIYWAPPAGESIASLAENRVRNLLNTLHRENSGDDVIVVTHGEFSWAMRMVLERWSDEEFLKNDKDPYHKIHNCSVIHYTRINPETGVEAKKLSWVRRAYPVIDKFSGKSHMELTDWHYFDRKRLTNEELLVVAEAQSRRL